MKLKQVNDIRLQHPQAFGDGSFDLFSQLPIRLALFADRRQLAGEDILAAPALERPADDLLAGAIGPRGIDEVDAQVEGLIEQARGVFLRRPQVLTRNRDAVV